MVIDLKDPFGPGLPTPNFQPWHGSNLAADPELNRLLNAPYYEDFIRNAAGPFPTGSIQNPSFEQMYRLAKPDPRWWSTIQAPQALNAPLLDPLGAKPTAGQTSKLGNFNLNLIHPWDSIVDASTTSLGQPGPSSGPGDQMYSDLGFSPMTALANFGQAPIKLIDRNLAVIREVTGGAIFGGPPSTDGDGQAVYPFEQDPAYWSWLRGATEEQITQFARAEAGNYYAAGRNDALFNSILERFRSDRDQIVLAMSSGDKAVDFAAKMNAYQNHIGTWNTDFDVLGLPGKLFTALKMVEASLPYASSWGTFDAGPEAEAYWASLTPEQRRKEIGQGQVFTLAESLMSMPVIFRGATSVAAAARASEAPTIARMATVWDRTLRYSQMAMASGLAIGAASWAAETFAPNTPAGQFGRKVNTGDVLGGSIAGEILNNVGFFASGTFGAALLTKATARLPGALERGAINVGTRFGVLEPGTMGPVARLNGWLWGTEETPFALTGTGGSTLRKTLGQAAGVPEQLSENAVRISLVNYLTKAEEADLLAFRQRVEDGLGTGTVLDDMAAKPLDVWKQDILDNLYASRQARMSNMATRWARLRQAMPLLPTSDELTTRVVDQWGLRRVVDEATRRYVADYGVQFFGADRLAIRQRIQQGLTEMGYTADMGKLDAALGTRDSSGTLDRWLQMARLVHQIQYVAEDANLRAAIHADPASAEEGLALFSTTTAFKDEMAAAEPLLRQGNADAWKLAADLVKEKREFRQLYATGEIGKPGSTFAPDPVRLADHIRDILDQDGFPKRRAQATDPETIGRPLNVFHRELAAKGKWELGFRERRPLPAEQRFAAALDQLMTPQEFAAAEPTLVTMADTVPAGYIELRPGQRFRRTNWAALEPIMTHDGHYWVRDDGTLSSMTAPVSGAAPRPTNDYSNPQPFDPHASYDAGEAFDALPERQQKLVLPVNKSGGSFGTFPGSYDLIDTGEVKSGRNYGANWPVLEDSEGNRWLFKAQYGQPIGDASPGRRLAGPTATKLFEYFGLHTSEETPFVWQGVKGTLQRLIDTTEPVDIGDLGRYGPEVRAELMKHHIVDWLTGQLDSNADSFLVGADGFIYGVDKGQAFKYFSHGEPWGLEGMLDPERFWTFKAWGGPKATDRLDVGVGDTHLGEFLLDAIRRDGITFSWSDIEPVLRQIEALPEDVYLAALKPLAEARAADGLGPVEEFYARAIAQKRAIRAAASQAFQAEGLATLTDAKAPWWAPQLRGRIDIGTDVYLNDRPVDTLSNHVEVAEPDPPATAQHYKAGVVVQEPDGRVWVIHPANGFGGYTHTWPKGRVDAGETFQQAAIREAAEETGLSVRIKAHLADVANEEGNVTRYYLAERVGGGPQFVGTPGEIGLVRLVPEGELTDHLWRNGAPDSRDNAVADALRTYRADQAASPEAGGVAAANTGQPETHGNPAADFQYVSHVRLRDGGLYETAWLAPDLIEKGQFNLGNRGIVGRAFDDVFGSWRAWRILNMQRLNLHRALTVKYDILPAQVDGFVDDLLALSEKNRGVGIQALAGSSEALPAVGAWPQQVRDLAEAHFGSGPFLNRQTGALDSIDFARQTVVAWRQAFRLNLLSGVTSYLKSMPGVGGYILPVTDVVYPLVRWGLSFIFKPSEIAESAMFNGMRGTWRTGDPLTDALYTQAGFGSGTGMLREERGTDMSLQAITSFSHLGGRRVKFGESPGMYARVDPAKMARAVADQLAPSSPLPPQTTSMLGDSIAGQHLEMPGPQFPDTYPTANRAFLRQIGVDEKGQPILQLNGGQQTLDQIAAQRGIVFGEIIQAILKDGDAAERYGAGMALLNNLPPGSIEKLAASVPAIHTMSDSGFDTEIGYLRAAIEAGNPLFPGKLSIGNVDLALYESKVGGRTVPQAEHRPGSNAVGASGGAYTSVSPGEQAVGFADAKYGSMASFYQFTGDNIIPILKPESLQRSVTLDTDRIHYGAQVPIIQDAMMTPAAVNGINRLITQRALVEWAARNPEQTLLEYLATSSRGYWDATNPFEMAYDGGIRSGEVAAMLIPSKYIDKWNAFVGEMKDHPGAAGLADIPIVPYDGSFESAYNAMWANAVERAGLLDLANSRPEDLGAFDKPGVLSLPSEALADAFALRPTARYLADTVLSEASAAGYDVKFTEGFSDRIGLQIAITRRRLKVLGAEGSPEQFGPPSSMYGAGVTPQELGKYEAQLTDLQALQRDVNEHLAKGGWANVQEAEKAGATDWATEDAALRARATALGVDLRNADANVGHVAVIDKTTAEVLARAPIPSAADIQLRYSQGSLPDPEELKRIAGARLALDVMQHRIPTGFRATLDRYETRFPPDTAQAIQQAVDSEAFRAALRARAKMTMGIDSGDPVIRAYIRGSSQDLVQRGSRTQAKGLELVVTVQDGAGAPYANLTLPEIADLWRSYGLPAELKTRLEAGGWDPAQGRLTATGFGDAWDGGTLLHSDTARPEGRVHYYKPGQTIHGSFDQTPAGRMWTDPGGLTQADVSFVNHFDSQGKSYVDLADGRTLYRDSIVVEPATSTRAMKVSKTDEYGGEAWSYSLSSGTGGVYNAQINDARGVAAGRYGSTSTITARVEALRDLFSRTNEEYAKFAAGKGGQSFSVRLTLDHVDDRLAFEKLALKGEIPDYLTAVDPMGKVVDRPAIAARINPAAAPELAKMTPPPATFEDVTPDGRLWQRIRDEAARMKGKTGKALHAAFVDPVPYKQRAQDRLTFHLMRERFAAYVGAEAPDAAKVFTELKVPKAKWLDFLVHDRYLLDRWVQTGARDDWEALIRHGDTYLGKGTAEATLKTLDELYANPSFDTLLSTLRIVMKGAQDEAYQVHFFSPYRSTFERSINHPVLGVYPASWAYKALKEWVRFLFQNTTLGFRAGMVPAQVIRQITDAQAKAFAQTSDQRLADWYQNGPYSNLIFIAELLMPGDWSSLPFPFSRTIRDIARGNTNVSDLVNKNLSTIGMFRDVRLTTGAVQEVMDTLAGNVNQGRRFKQAGIPNTTGFSITGEDLPAAAPPQPPSDVYIYR